MALKEKPHNCTSNFLNIAMSTIKHFDITTFFGGVFLEANISISWDLGALWLILGLIRSVLIRVKMAYLDCIHKLYDPELDAAIL